MVEQRFRVAVVIERRAVDNRWVNEVWRPVSIEFDAADCDAEKLDVRGAVRTDRSEFQTADPDGVRGALPREPEVSEKSAATYWRWPGFELEIHRSEAEGYYLNTSTAEPRAFVMWRMQDGRGIPVLVTVSYSEAARWLDGGAEVEAVDLPEEIRTYLDAWVAANYRPEPRKKARRNDPFREGAFRRDPK